MISVYSRKGRPAKEKSPRKEPRADNRADCPARTAGLLDRGGEYQPGDVERDEGGRDGDVADPRQDDDRQGRRDDVCLSCRRPLRSSTDSARDQIKEQQQLSDEIGNAITSNQTGEQMDEDDLEQELEGLEQEKMDERMLQPGTVPVGDRINQLPAAANGESKFFVSSDDASSGQMLTLPSRQQSKTSHQRRMRKTRRPSWRSCARKWLCDNDFYSQPCRFLSCIHDRLIFVQLLLVVSLPAFSNQMSRFPAFSSTIHLA